MYNRWVKAQRNNKQKNKQEIEANPDLQIFVLKNQMQMFAEQTKKILAEVQKLNKSLSK